MEDGRDLPNKETVTMTRIITHACLRHVALALVLATSLAMASPAPASAAPSVPSRQLLAPPQLHGWLARLWDTMTRLVGREGTVTDPTGHH